MKFGFIGAGNMVSAIVKGMTANGYDGKNIFITSKTVTSAAKLAEACRRKQLPDSRRSHCPERCGCAGGKTPYPGGNSAGLAGRISRQRNLWWCPLAAGKTLEYLAEHLPKDTPIVRVMPNINAKIGASTTGICHNDAVTAEQLQR